MISTSRYSESATSVKNASSEMSPGRVYAGAVWDNVPRQMPLATGEEVELHGEFPTQKQVRVIISQKALLEIDTHAHSDLLREVGGALLGRVVRYQAQTFVEVMAAVVAETADHGPVHFTFTADTWASISRQREEDYPQLDVVGWFHTHPDLGVFYSSDDVVVHSAAFTLPWQVGLVVDPVRQEACFFGWEPAAGGYEIQPITGFYEWLDVQAKPIVTWEVTHRGFRRSTELQGNDIRLSASPSLSLPAINPWWGLIFGGLSLLISLFLLIDRFLLSG